MGGGFIDALITIWLDMGLPWTSMTPVYITAIGATLLFPFFLRSIRISQARNLLKRSNALYHEQRREMEQQAIQKVKDIPVALLGLADQAIAMKRIQLAEEILTFVPMTKKYKRELQRVQRRIRPKNSIDSWAQIEKIKTLISQEMFAAAKIQRDKLPESVESDAEVLWIDQQLLQADDAG